MYRNWIINTFLVFLLVLILCSFQSSLWRSVFGTDLAPMAWLNVMRYMLLFRKPSHAILLNYSLILVLHAFSAAPIGLLLTIAGVITAIGTYVRQRFFWPSTRYFVMASLLFTLTFHLAYWLISLMVEQNPAHFHLFSRLVSTVLTALTAAPIYWTLSILDRVTQIDLVPESSGAHE